MKYAVRKYMLDYEKEEKWLNQMALIGMNFVHYSFAKYFFEEGKPGEYIYRIELLENLPSHPQSAAYIKFMEGLGIECVATWFRWVYFRKKSADGPFDLYSDCESRVRHYKRVLTLIGILLALNAFTGLFNIFLPFFLHESILHCPNFLLGWINLALCGAFTPMTCCYCGKIKRITQEKQLRE